ncbi:MAG: site-specific DNA-methyltransferase [Gammaproteobacteria bacterium]|nr:site-specific DNA-methyltransferase [Gammaproteobacteria bacterium]
MWTNEQMQDKMNKVHHIDCMLGLKTIQDKSIDLLLTDIPYGMDFQSNHRQIKHKKIENDKDTNWFLDWAKEIDRVCKEDSHLYIFCSHHKVDFFKSEIQKYRNVKNILIWEKNNTGMGDLFGDYAPKYEMVLFCSNGNKKLCGGRDANIIKANRTQNNLHPTEKPVDLMEYFIRKSSNENDLVLDTFAGSGSTLLGAKQTRRNFIGFEIEADYVAIANKRLEAVQGSLF